MAKANKRKQQQAARQSAAINDDFRRAIAERLIDGADPDLLAQQMASGGLQLGIVQAEIERAAKSPYLQASARLRERIGKWEWVLQNGAQQLSLAVHGRYLLNNVGMLRRLALLGQGIAMLVDEMIAEDLACGRLQRVLPGWQAPSLPVYAITETRLLPAKVRVLIDFLGERLNRR